MKLYGRAKVDRWRENGKLKRYLKENGKLNGFQYRVADLEKLSKQFFIVKQKKNIMNHCIEINCPDCKQVYCVRCHSFVCPYCGTPTPKEID